MRSSTVKQNPERLPVGGHTHGVVEVLLAGAPNVPDTARMSEHSVRPKFFWAEASGNMDAVWPIDVQRTGQYAVHAVIRVHTDAGVTIAVDGRPQPAVRVDGEAGHEHGWQRVAVGTVALTPGPHELSIAVEADGSDTVAIRSVELVHEADADALADRVEAFRTASAETRRRWRESDFGIMFQYGPWSYPRSGDDLPPLDRHVDDFDVEAFADRMKELGAGHVVWSATWWSFLLAAPCTAVDEVAGEGLTARRDLIGELAAALQARGIMFFLYFHLGHDEHKGYATTQWWREQNWPDSFTRNGIGDRSAALGNTRRVLRELGERYGRNLDGWFLDDGVCYYPMDFEELAVAARAGNPGRLLSVNSWILPRLTDFQDIHFGEGAREVEGTDIAADGTHRAGSYAGLVAHAMPTLQPEWGVHDPDQRVDVDDWARGGLRDFVEEARRHSVAVTLDILMWYPGVLDPVAEEVIAQLNSRAL